MRKHVYFLVMGILVSCGSMAQSSVSHRVVLHIPNSASIRLTPDTDPKLLYDFDSAEKIENGITQQQAVSYQIRSNAKWVVQIKARNPTFSYEGEGEDPKMPVTILKVKKSDSDNGFIPLSVENTVFAKGNKGDYGGENEVKLDYQVTPGFDFPRGSYSMEVALTISNP